MSLPAVLLRELNVFFQSNRRKRCFQGNRRSILFATDCVEYMPALLMSTYKMADRSKSRRSTFPNIDKFELPIRDYRRNLVRAVEENDFLVVVGETGSGKTTQLPQYLYKAGFTSHDKMIGVTQPRRIAAISVATRVSEEMKCHLGGYCFYLIRSHSLM